MGRNVTLDFSAGGGSDTEFLIGTITLEPTLMHELGNRVVLPMPRTTGINAGMGTLEDVAISPAGPEPAWAYRATVRDSISGKAQTWLVGVPTGTTAIPFKQLTKFTTTIPPQTTAGMMQNWADTTETNADRSELAADRAEAPTDLMNKTLIENEASLTAGALSAAIVESSAPASLPVASGVIVGSEGTARVIDYFDGRLWGAGASGEIFTSTNNGATWVQVGTSPSRLIRILRASGGEMVGISATTAYRSTGWSANPATATWAATTTADGGPTATFQGFGIDGQDNKFILTEYTSARVDSRYVKISLDGGVTWSIEWNTAVEFPGTHFESHIHAACYDRWEDRFYFSEGHGGPKGIYFSDDDGQTWTRMTGGVADTLEPTPTVMTATDTGIVCGTDAPVHSVYGIRRGSDALVPLLRWQVPADGVVGFGQVGWRDERDGLVYIGFYSASASVNPIVTVGTANEAQIAWTSPDTGLESRVWGAYVTDSDKFVAHIAAAGNTNHRTAIGSVARAGKSSVGTVDTGNVLGGDTQDRNSSMSAGIGAKATEQHSVALGPGATAGGGVNGKSTATGWNALAGLQSTAMGAEAVASGSSSVALGWKAVASANQSCAFGQQAQATQNEGTAFGFDSKVTVARGAAFGASASAAGASGTALGPLSSVLAGHTNSVALGRDSTTTALQQVQIGPRHVESSEVASTPAAPSGGVVRHFAVNNAGTTEYRFLFNGGFTPVAITAQGAVRVRAMITASRPTAASQGAGAMLFDTSLGKPIWSNGTDWVDATGAVA